MSPAHSGYVLFKYAFCSAPGLAEEEEEEEEEELYKVGSETEAPSSDPLGSASPLEPSPHEKRYRRDPGWLGQGWR